MDLLCEGYEDVEHHLLPHLTLPSLSRFSLTDRLYKGFVETNPTSFMSLLSRSSCRLVDLDFSNLWQNFMPELLSSIPTLQSLVLDSGRFTRDVMDQLGQGAYGDSLTALGAQVFLTDTDAFFKMLHRRWAREARGDSPVDAANPASLKHVSAFLWDPEHPDHVGEAVVQPLEDRVREIQEKYHLEQRLVEFIIPQKNILQLYYSFT
jgi:hypothetical protein